MSKRLAVILTIMISGALPAAADFNPGVFQVERVFPSLSFARMVQLLELPDGSGRFLVADRNGVISIFDSDEAVPAPTVWLDISDRVATRRDFALNGFALDPDFLSNRRVYLHYNWDNGLGQSDLDYGSARVSRFIAEEGLGSVSAATEEIIYTHRQPKLDGVTNPLQDHNGGNIVFGPDGMLYIAFGDGGSDPRVPTSDLSGQDPLGHGQSTVDPFASILRIDVTGTPDDGKAYAIPTDNPFFDGGPDGTDTMKEIYAYGFRNPWRIAFDPLTGSLFAADVGAKAREEVNLVLAGGNYGWSDMEGSDCFPPGTDACDPQQYELPIAEIVWAGASGERHSISGGYVYTGTQLPTLHGAYLYSDYLTGGVWALRHENGTTEVAELLTPISSFPANPTHLWVAFGQDQAGEVYLLDYKDNGGIYKLIYDPNQPTPTPTAGGGEQFELY